MQMDLYLYLHSLVFYVGQWVFKFILQFKGFETRGSIVSYVIFGYDGGIQQNVEENGGGMFTLWLQG